jgi:hypothetical protein
MCSDNLASFDTLTHGSREWPKRALAIMANFFPELRRLSRIEQAKIADAAQETLDLHNVERISGR